MVFDEASAINFVVQIFVLATLVNSDRVLGWKMKKELNDSDHTPELMLTRSAPLNHAK